MSFLTLAHHVLAQADAVARETVDRHASYQPFIFWAYGLACVLIFAFTIATLRQLRRVEDHLRALDERLAETGRPQPKTDRSEWTPEANSASK